MRRHIIIEIAALAAASILHPLHAQEVKAPEVTQRAVLTTTEGDIEIELYGKDAPKAVKNFVGLINKGFYDGILFHRVVPGSIIQAGDPQTRDTAKRSLWGTGGQSFYPGGGEFEDELNPATPSYKRGYVEGTLAMASRGPNTNTSQFFIMLANNSALQHPIQKLFTIFGKVVKGMDVVHKIELLALTGPNGLPMKPVIILRAKAVDASPAAK